MAIRLRIVTYGLIIGQPGSIMIIDVTSFRSKWWVATSPCKRCRCDNQALRPILISAKSEGEQGQICRFYAKSQFMAAELVKIY